MSAALRDDVASAIALEKKRRKLQEERIAATLAELRSGGVRESTVAAVAESLHRLGGPDADANPEGLFRNAEAYDAVLDAYLPDRLPNGDLVHDPAATLRRRIEANLPVTFDVHCPAYDGRSETLHLDAKESRAYVEGDLATQGRIRVAKIRERRLTTAIDAASRLLKESGRRAMIEARITADEELCLLEFAGLTTAPKTVETATGRKRSIERVVRDGWVRRARVALRERNADLDPVKLRELWGYDFDQGAEIGRGPVPAIGGMYGSNDLVHGHAFARLYGPNELQVSLADTWDEMARSADAYERDPFAKQGINISTDFVLGRGVNVVANDDGGHEDGQEVDGVQDEIDAFLKRHPLALWKKWLRSGKVMGDLFLWQVPQMDGLLKFMKLPARSIWAVVTLSEDVTQPLFYVQRYVTRFQFYAPKGDESHYVERIIPAEEVLHFKRNASEDEVRGRSDIFSALPWHYRFRSHWDAQIEKDYAANAFAFYAKVKGTMGAVNRFVATSVPRGRVTPGSWLVQNDKVEEFKVVTSDKTQPAGSGSTSEGILNALAASYGFPKEYFGVSGNRSRGGAVVAEGPVQKAFEDQQDDWGAFMSQAITRQIEAAVAWGRIAATADITFRVDFPDIIKADGPPRLTMLTVLRAQGGLSLETYSNLAASITDLGDTYDYAAERERIALEAEKGIALPQMPPHFDPIDPPGGGGPPNPTSATGQQQIRHDDQHAEALDEYEDDALAEALAARGATVILR